jgi:hypothetical protein
MVKSPNWNTSQIGNHCLPFYLAACARVGKHDGFRIIARKDGERVRLYSRPGNDFTRRFPLIVETLTRLRSRLQSAHSVRQVLTAYSSCLPGQPTCRL